MMVPMLATPAAFSAATGKPGNACRTVVESVNGCPGTTFPPESIKCSTHIAVMAFDSDATEWF